MRIVESINKFLEPEYHDLANKFQCSGILRAFVLLAVAFTARVLVMWRSMYMGNFHSTHPQN